MKIFVDEMFKNETECPWHEWHPLPPCYEETGYYKCKLNKKYCNLTENECHFFRTFKIKNKYLTLN